MQNNGNPIVRSVVSGIGIAILYLLAGTVLDYIITQILSQFVVRDCSEDCYFRYFNFIFILVAVLSLAGGIRAGIRTYKRLSEKQ
jgi:hypothetical protein